MRRSASAVELSTFATEKSGVQIPPPPSREANRTVPHRARLGCSECRAWERARTASDSTQVGRVVDADAIPDAVGAFVRVAEGTSWVDAGFPGDPAAVAMDIRAYYEEAAHGLAGHVPAARAAESWLFQLTETGTVLKVALTAMAAADPPYERIFYLVPLSQQS